MDEVSHRLIARQEAHKRIIWACSWNPFGHEFATGSRDKNVKIWAVDKGSSVKQLMTLPQFSSSVTALSWYALDDQRNNGFLAVGMESGLIELWSLSLTRPQDGSTTMVPKLGRVRYDSAESSPPRASPCRDGYQIRYPLINR